MTDPTITRCTVNGVTFDCAGDCITPSMAEPYLCTAWAMHEDGCHTYCAGSWGCTGQPHTRDNCPCGMSDPDPATHKQAAEYTASVIADAIREAAETIADALRRS